MCSDSDLPPSESQSQSLLLPPPLYRESSPPPFYTESPAEDEEILSTSRSYSNSPTGTFAAKCHCSTLKLIMHEQREDIDMPVYHRQGLIRGTISYCSPLDASTVERVLFKVEGKLKMNAIGEKPVSTSFVFLEDTIELWAKPKRRLEPGESEVICPPDIEFAYVLPKTFRDEDEGKEYPLPPSHEISIMGTVPGLQSQCVYTAKVVIVTRGSFWMPLKTGSLFKRTTTFPIPFKYLPRSRPAEPPISHDGRVTPGATYPSSLFHATIKRAPELWFESSSVLQPRPDGSASQSLTPIDVQLFIPSGRTFGLTDKIPFHIQLTGTAVSLKTLYSHLPPEQVFETSSGSLAFTGCSSQSTTATTTNGSISITVSLSRQVYLKIKDEAVWKSIVIGEGSIHPLPPPFESEYCADSNTDIDPSVMRGYDPDKIENLDGAGEVQCRPDTVHFGHFDSGRLRVKDYLILQIGPLKSTDDAKLPFSTLRMSVPVLMVSDSYSESG